MAGRVLPRALSENSNAGISGNGCRLRSPFQGWVQASRLAQGTSVARQPQRNARRSPSPDCRAGLNSPIVACADGRS